MYYNYTMISSLALVADGRFLLSPLNDFRVSIIFPYSYLGSVVMTLDRLPHYPNAVHARFYNDEVEQDQINPIVW